MTSVTVDEFSSKLWEESKRFREKASESSDSEAKSAFVHAALMLGFSSLEAHLNAVCDEMMLRHDLTVLDRSILLERDYALDQGVWTLQDRLKMYRIEDRLRFAMTRFSQSAANPSTAAWWNDFKEGLDARNRLVHPKAELTVTVVALDRYLTAILEATNSIYLSVYSKSHPAYNRHLDSNLQF